LKRANGKLTQMNSDLQLSDNQPSRRDNVFTSEPYLKLMEEKRAADETNHQFLKQVQVMKEAIRDSKDREALNI